MQHKESLRNFSKLIAPEKREYVFPYCHWKEYTKLVAAYDA